MGAALNGIIFDDLEWPLALVSWSRDTNKSNISQNVREFLIVQSTVVDHYVMRKHLHHSPLELKNFASHLSLSESLWLANFFRNSSLGLDYVLYATLRCCWHWTLDIRPIVVLLLRIVLIQLLAAKPNKSIIIITRGSTENVQKIWGHRWNLFAEIAGKCFTPVIEIKPNTDSLHWHFYGDIQLIRGRVLATTMDA